MIPNRRQQVQNGFAAAAPTILEITRDHETTIETLIDMGLISRRRACVDENCDGRMIWIQDPSKADGYRFRCRHCDATCSIRRDTIFQGSHLSLMELTRIYFHYFLRGISIKICARELALTKKTVGKLYSKLRSAISQYVTEFMQVEFMGEEPQDGPNVTEEHAYPVVECDESLFSHITQNGVREQVWVFGLYDRGSDECRLFVVPDRTADTLENLILENVAPDTVIYTDRWEGYRNLNNLNYIHRVVQHNRGFGRGLDTTNGIESIWSQIKRLSSVYRGIQGRGENARIQIQDYINHGVWLRHVNGNDAVEELAEVINSIFTRN